MRILAVEGLPEEAVAAAAAFYAGFAARAAALTGQGDMALVFAPADHTHRAWRLAAVQGLARVAAPYRVNAVESDDAEAVAQALAYLQAAPGITGQMLRLDSQGAGVVLG